MEEERLSKFIARKGLASRRKAEQIVRSGRVAVNGVIVKDPHQRIFPGSDAISLDNERIGAGGAPKKRYYVALYKPTGYLSDLADPRGRRLARQLIDLEAHLFPVGRLDYNSEGLMLFTNDGEFANSIMHPRYEVEKEYLVKLSGSLTKEELLRMTTGIPVEGQVYHVRSIVPFRHTPKNAWYRVTVVEGRNRMIRKMADAVHHPVLKLKRVRIDGITLGDMRPGEYRLITPRGLTVHHASRSHPPI
jgi:23S rRNA pseudouridine2605 synthase